MSQYTHKRLLNRVPISFTIPFREGDTIKLITGHTLTVRSIEVVEDPGVRTNTIVVKGTEGQVTPLSYVLDHFDGVIEKPTRVYTVKIEQYGSNEDFTDDIREEIMLALGGLDADTDLDVKVSSPTNSTGAPLSVAPEWNG